MEELSMELISRRFNHIR